MRERRALRFLVEALFLGALAAALALADRGPLVIAGGMAVGWLVVALYEWAATREVPHYGRGLPPRYYVPEISLPPPRQLEQLRSGYPRAADRDEPATWIATPAMRAEALADWPAAGTLPPPTPGEDTMVVDEAVFVGAANEPFHEDTWVELHPSAEGRDDEAHAVAVAEPEVEEPALEPEPAPEREPEIAAADTAAEEVALEAAEAPVVEAVVAAEVLDAAVAADSEALAEPEVAAEPEAKRRRMWRRSKPQGEAVVAAAVVADDAEAVAEPEELEPEQEPDAAAVEEPEVVAEPEPEPEPEPVAAAVVTDEPEVREEPETEEEEEDTEEDVSEPAAVEAAVAAPERLVRHTFDPLGEATEPRKRWRRRDDPWVELPDRPPPPTVLPGQSKRKR